MFIPAIYVVMCLNGTAYNLSSIQGLGVYTNDALNACQGAPPYSFGYAILFIVFLVIFGISALRFDPTIAGAVASFVSVGVALLLSQLLWLSSGAVGIPVVLSIIFVALALVKGALKPY